MEQDNLDQFRKPRTSRILSGLVLVAAGLLLLAYKMGAPIPGWIFTWPVLLITIGLLTGISSRFHNPGSIIMILIGAIFLADQSIPGVDLHNYIAPIILICVGLVFVLRPRRGGCRRRGRYWRAENMSPGDPYAQEDFKPSETNAPGDNAEYIDLHSVLGGVKRNILSKNFKGGEIVSFMGGSEINFMQADIQHPVVLEVNNVFGGTKLIIPSNWDVQNEISAVFGGVDDRRAVNNSVPDSQKRMVLKGSCVFGGIEITNY